MVRSGFLLMMLFVIGTSVEAQAASICSDIFVSDLRLTPKELAETVYFELDQKLPGDSIIDLKRREVLRIVNGKEVASLEFFVARDLDMRPSLEILGIKVAAELRGTGMSRLLLAGLLKELPPVSVITSEALVASNYDAFTSAQRAGLSAVDAIRSTPAYKLRRSLGYAKIDFRESILSSDDVPKLVVEAGPENEPPPSLMQRLRAWWGR